LNIEVVAYLISIHFRLFETYIYHSPVDWEQYFYDPCLLWAFEI